MKLTQKQELFCIEYAKSGNGDQSAIKAGYAPKNARITASKLLTQANINARLKELNNDYKKASIADIQEIQSILTSILRGEQTDDVPMVVNNGSYSEIVHTDKRADTQARIKAGDLLAKMQGGYDTTIKLDVAPIVIKDDLA